MKRDEAQENARTRRLPLARWTRVAELSSSLFEEPARGSRAWVRTTAGVVAMLLTLQVLTGALLAFYYVPYAPAAHTTVVYIEKVAPAGAWIRALHHYGSQWLTLFLFLHILQKFWLGSYRRKPVGWTASVLLLALIFSEGATGYSLPWDTRAFFSTRVAEGIAGGLPFVGASVRRWLLGGTELSPLTLLRFFALHVLAGPAAILTVAAARLFIFRDRSSETEREAEDRAWMREQLARNAIAAGIAFLALALFAARFHAPLGPAADEAAPGYLPRPGAQFLWLFQMLKYLPGRAGALVAVLIPSSIFIALLALPFLDSENARQNLSRLSRRAGATVLTATLVLVVSMTALAYIQDRRDTRTRAQLDQQSADEAAFRAVPFEPLRLRAHQQSDDESEADAQTNANINASSQANSNTANTSSPANQNASSASSAGNPPEAYLKNCSNCHGTRGQGFSIFPKLTGVSAKPRRTIEDLIAIMNDPAAYGLRPPMKSYADKLAEEEKRQIAEWLTTLKDSKNVNRK